MICFCKGGRLPGKCGQSAFLRSLRGPSDRKLGPRSAEPMTSGGLNNCFANGGAESRSYAAMIESCSVCGSQFEPQFRYQMEETAAASPSTAPRRASNEEPGGTGGDGSVTCDACAKSFQVELVSSVFYVERAAALRVLAWPAARSSRARRRARGSARIAASQSLPPRSGSRGPERRSQTPPPPQPSVPRAVTSSRSSTTRAGTGKTTTSVSLAAGLAMRGQARAPRRHRFAGQRRRLAQREGRALALPRGRHGASRSTTRSPRFATTSISSPPTNRLPPPSSTSQAARTATACSRDASMPRERAYDVIVLDCSPSLSLMNQNALVFADSVLVPVACDYLSLVGVRQVIRTVKNVNQLLHHPVQIWGVLADVLRCARAHLPRSARHDARSLRRSMPRRRSARP